MFFPVKLNYQRKNKGSCMRYIYGFCKNDSRILKHTENITSFTAYDFQDCLHYSEGNIEKKELMTHCKEFNDFFHII